MIKHRSVLLREWEVRAIMDGRLTMLARPVRRQPVHDDRAWGIYWDRPNVEGRYGPCAWGLSEPVPGSVYLHSPFGAVGDVLLGKEAWFEVYSQDTAKPLDPPKACYRATETDEVIKIGDDGCSEINRDGTFASPWRSSSSMPQWAVRIRLRVESVACKQVWEITEDECCNLGFDQKGVVATFEPHATIWFRSKWAADNPRHPWASNPWCWLARVGRVTP